jgi:glycine cleavage system T protein (aminomethyltransferase)
VAARRTPLHPQHLAAGARMVEFGGWEMPQQYQSVKQEHQAVRTGAGLFDVSHMGRFVVEGAAGADFLQSVVTNDVTKVGPGRAQYNLLCRPDAGILDDLVIYRGQTDDAPWRVVVNAAYREKDLAWLREHAPAGVSVSDVSDSVALLAIQGPKVEELLPASGVDLTSIPYFGWAEGEVAGVPALLSRTGYTGEDGFELFLPADRVGSVWDALVEAGAVPCGLAARDVCRLEAGLRLSGTDMDEETNPYEAGLGWTVKLAKGEFVGRQALAEVKEAGPARRLVGIQCGERVIPRHGAAVTHDGASIGTVTSGTHSFWLDRGIGFASVAAGSVTVGAQLQIEARGGLGAAEVVSLPFYRGSVRQ